MDANAQQLADRVRKGHRHTDDVISAITNLSNIQARLHGENREHQEVWGAHDSEVQSSIN